MTRREITENRIIQNILIHNDPKDAHSYDNLYISNRSASSEVVRANNTTQMTSQPNLHPNMSLSSKYGANGQQNPGQPGSNAGLSITAIGGGGQQMTI
jgi:hypothetical protein